MTIWWSLKIFVGSLSDCYPIWGYRRKSYVLIGWSIAIALTVVAICLGQPYKGADTWKWLLCFSFINMGYIIGDVAMDSMVTDLAQREPLAERGQLQSQIYLVRTVAMSLTAALTSFGFSSVEYGGAFAWYASSRMVDWASLV
jgi:hypothetical protein